MNWNSVCVGFALGAVIDAIVYMFLFHRALKRWNRDTTKLCDELHAGYQKKIQEQHEGFKRIMLNVGQSLQQRLPTETGLLQIINENKPDYLTLRETLVELLKRCDN